MPKDDNVLHYTEKFSAAIECFVNCIQDADKEILPFFRSLFKQFKASTRAIVKMGFCGDYREIKVKNID